MRRTSVAEERWPETPSAPRAGDAPIMRAYAKDPSVLHRVLKEIESADLKALRTLWSVHLGSAVPKLSAREILARLLAWKIQETVLGGYDAWTKRRLRELAQAFERDPAYAVPTPVSLRPGIVLTREWQGIQHRVLVQDKGFLHQGTVYTSLTKVARAITGTAWSGPRFFGLEAEAQRTSGGMEKRP